MLPSLPRHAVSVACEVVEALLDSRPYRVSPRCSHTRYWSVSESPFLIVTGPCFGCFRIREVLLAEGISREQAVGAHVPARRRAKTFRVAHDRDADRFAVDGARVIDPSADCPRRPRPPCLRCSRCGRLFWHSTRIESATRTANEPSFVSPNVTSPSVALIVIVKSIHRLPSGSLPKITCALVLADALVAVHPIVAVTIFGRLAACRLSQTRDG